MLEKPLGRVDFPPPPPVEIGLREFLQYSQMCYFRHLNRLGNNFQLEMSGSIQRGHFQKSVNTVNINARRCVKVVVEILNSPVKIV